MVCKKVGSNKLYAAVIACTRINIYPKQKKRRFTQTDLYARL